LQRYNRGKTVIIWLAALCLLAFHAIAQTDPTTHISTTKKTTTKKTTTTKKNATTSTAKKSTAHSTSTKHTTSTARKSRTSKSSKKTVARGQQKIEPQRAQEIQEALIREHYLDGEPAGTWNQASEDALRRYQADHGWQSKTVPDSRALISLGLGPSHDHLLNPESAMTTGPEMPHPASISSSSQPPTSHNAGSPAVTSPTTDPATATPAHDSSDPQNKP
jgi:hypothetical protein